MIPVISVVGYANSGKTTVLRKIIGELKLRGYKVAIIKHHGGDFDIDHEGKDTYKHMEAGAITTMLSSPNKFAMVSKLEQEKTLDELISYIENVDIIITEGYKKENKPKIEVFRKSNNSERIKNIEKELVAVISDDEITEDISKFSFENIKGVVDFIEVGYILQNTTVEN